MWFKKLLCRSFFITFFLYKIPDGGEFSYKIERLLNVISVYDGKIILNANDFSFEELGELLIHKNKEIERIKNLKENLSQEEKQKQQQLERKIHERNQYLERIAKSHSKK